MSRSHASLCLAATGMITPVGFNTITTTAAVRAGHNAYFESEFFNRDYNPMLIAKVPDTALPPLHKKLWHAEGLGDRQRRLLQLVVHALADVVAVSPPTQSLPLFLAGPETLPGCPTALPANFIEHVMTQTGVEFHRPDCRLLTTGRAGGLHAVELAFRYFEQTSSDYVLIGGVDSYQDRFLLEKLDKEDRILAQDIKDGFAPGEAASFLLLATQRGVGALKQPPLAAVYRPGFANEAGHQYSQAPYLGDGLAVAFSTAIAQGNGEPIRTVYSSMNGEHFWAKEHGVAMTRNYLHMDEKVMHEHPADCFGDLGAACGPVMIGMAAMGMQQGYSSSSCLIGCSSENEQRAAVCVTRK